MAVKDSDTSENNDRGKKASEDWKDHETTDKRYRENAKGVGETAIKNAHATGTGSIGRNESSLPEEDENDKKEATSY